MEMILVKLLFCYNQRWIVPPNYHRIDTANDHTRFIARTATNYFLLDSEGQALHEQPYNDIERTQTVDTPFIAQRNGYWQGLDQSGNPIGTPRNEWYRKTNPSKTIDGYEAKQLEEGKWQITDPSGNIRLRFDAEDVEIEEISFFHQETAIFKYKQKGQAILPTCPSRPN